MHPMLTKTLGGLDKQYYFRQLFFGTLMGGFVLTMARSTEVGQVAFVIVSTLLYPYARFVYESIINFIVGKNMFFANAILFLAFKLITMVMCWAAAIFIAPIGLAYLYFRHSRVGK